MNELINSAFKAPRILRNANLQTALAVLGRYRFKAAIYWEELALPDGDFVDLVWLGNQVEGPIAILIPGLEGGLHAPYIASLVDPLLAESWRVVVVHFRSCSGRINSLPRGYSANDSDDLELIVASLRMQNPGITMVAIGFSLGASILLKMLEGHSDLKFPNDYITAAVGVSVPYDLGLTVDYIPAFYQGWMLRSMKAKVKQKMDAGFDLPISLEQLKAIKTLREFDTLITAPLHEFPTVDAYYEGSSCGKDLDKIKSDTLLIHALDDPLVPKSCIPTSESLGERTRLELSPNGGHLGFLSSHFPWCWRRWLTQRIVEFVRPYIGDNE